MIKKILPLISILLFVGCSSKELYTLGDTSHIKQIKRSREFIAIDKIRLPNYFINSAIYIKDTPYHLKKIEDAYWIDSMDRHLTRVLISYLQKSLNNTNIYPYPWSTIKLMDRRVTLTIDRFIAYKSRVYLEANYTILNKNNNKTMNYIFNTKEVIKDNSIDSIINSMERAYFKLCKDISNKL